VYDCREDDVFRGAPIVVPNSITKLSESDRVFRGDFSCGELAMVDSLHLKSRLFKTLILFDLWLNLQISNYKKSQSFVLEKGKNNSTAKPAGSKRLFDERCKPAGLLKVCTYWHL
jgi:hypothetical protein